MGAEEVIVQATNVILTDYNRRLSDIESFIKRCQACPNRDTYQSCADLKEAHAGVLHLLEDERAKVAEMQRTIDMQEQCLQDWRMIAAKAEERVVHMRALVKE